MKKFEEHHNFLYPEDFSISKQISIYTWFQLLYDEIFNIDRLYNVYVVVILFSLINTYPNNLKKSFSTGSMKLQIICNYRHQQNLNKMYLISKSFIIFANIGIQIDFCDD